MKITVTVEEICDKGLWMEFCRLHGWNEWAINEGRVSSDEEVTLTLEEAKQLGLFPES